MLFRLRHWSLCSVIISVIISAKSEHVLGIPDRYAVSSYLHWAYIKTNSQSSPSKSKLLMWGTMHIFIGCYEYIYNFFLIFSNSNDPTLIFFLTCRILTLAWCIGYQQYFAILLGPELSFPVVSMCVQSFWCFFFQCSVVSLSFFDLEGSSSELDGQWCEEPTHETRLDHNTRIYVLYSFPQVCGFFKVPC